MKSPKVALFYDWLNQWGGAERVLLDLIKLYPNAPIFTLVHDPKKTKWLPPQTKVITSFINKLPYSQKNSVLHTPLYSFALEQFDFSEYDLVISTTSIAGYCLLTHPKTLFVCYFHNINRYVYQTPIQFSLLKPFLNLYQHLDFVYAQRPDYVLCNSKTVQSRILKTFNRQSVVINPGINLNEFKPAKTTSNSKYFLVVSRLVKHKKIDLVIKSCHNLGLNLIVVGDGRDKKQINKLVTTLNNPKIKLLGKVSSKKLIYLYQHCQALICPQEEDFGLAPLEAQSCGKPVIAFDKGGITETIINKKTGLFFDKQSVESIASKLIDFKSFQFKTNDCTKNAAKFSQQNFMLNFKKTINCLWEKHQKNQIITS